MRKILLVLLLISNAVLSFSQEREKIPLVDPVFRGASLHFDVASPVMGIVVEPNTVNVELVADVNLYDRFFPVFELGYTSISKALEERTYSTQAPFFRLGMNFNIISTANNKGIYKDNKNYAYLGVRYAFSMLGYELNNVEIKNDYWDTSYIKNYNNPFVYCGWAEVHGGVRIDMARGFTMGWSVGIKFLMHTSDKNKTMLWYVPGYGQGNPVNFAFKYTLGYTFKTKKARELIGTNLVPND